MGPGGAAGGLARSGRGLARRRATRASSRVPRRARDARAARHRRALGIRRLPPHRPLHPVRPRVARHRRLGVHRSRVLSRARVAAGGRPPPPRQGGPVACRAAWHRGDARHRRAERPCDHAGVRQPVRPLLGRGGRSAAIRGHRCCDRARARHVARRARVPSPAAARPRLRGGERVPDDPGTRDGRAPVRPALMARVQRAAPRSHGSGRTRVGPGDHRAHVVRAARYRAKHLRGARVGAGGRGGCRTRHGDDRMAGDATGALPARDAGHLRRHADSGGANARQRDARRVRGGGHARALRVRRSLAAGHGPHPARVGRTRPARACARRGPARAAGPRLPTAPPRTRRSPR